MWPTDDEVWLAKQLGHSPVGRCCSCDWEPDNPRIPDRIQLANHLWTSIHEAATKVDEGGERMEVEDARGIAAVRGHHPESLNTLDDACQGCAWRQWTKGDTFDDHATQIATDALRELSAFQERELRADH